MFGKTLCFFLFVFVNSLAMEIDIPGSLNKLGDLTNKCEHEIERTSRSIREAGLKYDEIARDRYECIQNVYKSMKNGISETITKAITQGLQKNKPVSSYECISNAASELVKKLDGIQSSIFPDYSQIKNKHLEKIYSLNSLVSSFIKITKMLYENKRKEIIEAKTEEERKKILAEAEGKMKQIATVVGQICENVIKSKFVFFEDFVNYVHKTENNMNKINREGNQKIMFCVF